MRVYIYTLGCRLNQCESEAIADSFVRSGFDVIDDYKDADLTIVNSCTVTSKAEQKARRMIRLFSKSSSAVVVTGCYAEVAKSEIEQLAGNIFVFTLSQKAAILELAAYIKENDDLRISLFDSVSAFKKHDRSVFDFDPSSFSYHSRAYLKIQDGCDNSCGFCATTIARGPSVFLDSDEIVRRALKLEKAGLHEIMLTGVNLTNYDHSGLTLGGLMEKLLGSVGPDMRFRLSSMEPDHVDDRLLDAIADSRVQPHFHIPIQSASQKVLTIINRHYSIEHVDYIINRLREVKDDPFIACDVIAGLPGEGEEEFSETYEFMKKNDFSAMHVFPYSPRPRTPLCNTHHPEERVRDERAERLRALSAKQSHEYVARQLGKPCEILVEKNGTGTTGNYLKAKICTDNTSQIIKEGEIYKGVFSSVFPLIVSV